MDALSEALSTVRMTGAIFFNAECSAPWGFAVPATKDVSHVLSPGTELLIDYHLVIEGRAVGRMDGMEDLVLGAGDVVILPYGDPHTVSNGSPNAYIDSSASLEAILKGDGSAMRIGGGGELTRFACGFFGCERHAERLFLAGLPRVIRFNIRDGRAGAWLETSIRHLVSEAGSGRPGQKALLSKMAEVLFIEGLRRYMEQLPPDQTGWLAAARDPIVGAVLALLHREPTHDWSLEEMAAAAGSSRSVVAKRFNELIGESPLAYLARWRLELAARQLRASRKTVIEVAAEVGYESEAAFNRAFKRAFGLPPAQYRRRASADVKQQLSA